MTGGLPTARGAASARAALAGNPSDGYGGAVLAVTVDGLRAEAVATQASCTNIEPRSPLVAAALARFARELAPAAQPTAVEWRTDIPRGVGLGGSSAIVIATVRALCGLYGVSLAPAELASFALSVETEELGIVAGLQDRVAQAHGGVTFMEFGRRRRYERLEPALVPPLVIAWVKGAAQDSHFVHVALRSRFEDGSPGVATAMRELARLARCGRDALLTNDREELGRAVDGSFEIRREVMALEPQHVALVERARALGANVNYTGSGGAIAAVCREGRHAAEVGSELGAAGYGELLIP